MNNGKLKGTIRPQGVMKGRISRVIETVDPVIQPLEVTENGEYTAPENVHGFNPVKVDVPIRYEEGYQDGYKAMQDGLQEKEITANGEYTADEGHTGLSKVNVNVSMDNPGKPFIDTSKITNFEYFCYANRMNEQVDSIDTSSGTCFSNCFRSCNNLKKITKLDVSKGSLFNECFYECYALESLPPLDISNGTLFTGMFTNCRKLDNISLTVPKRGFSPNTFSSCVGLTNITIGQGWNVNIYLHYSNNLTVESLHGMIENLADLTGLTAKTFQIGATNLAKIDQTHLDMLVAKNWSYS